MTSTTDPRALMESDCKFFETWAADIRAGGVCSSDADKMDAMCARYRAALDRTAKTEAERDYNMRDADHLRNVVDRLNAENERLREALSASRETHCGIAEHILQGGTNTKGIFADSQRARLAIDEALKGADQ